MCLLNGVTIWPQVEPYAHPRCRVKARVKPVSADVSTSLP